MALEDMRCATERVHLACDLIGAQPFVWRYEAKVVNIYLIDIRISHWHVGIPIMHIITNLH